MRWMLWAARNYTHNRIFARMFARICGNISQSINFLFFLFSVHFFFVVTLPLIITSILVCLPSCLLIFHSPPIMMTFNYGAFVVFRWVEDVSRENCRHHRWSFYPNIPHLMKIGSEKFTFFTYLSPLSQPIIIAE